MKHGDARLLDLVDDQTRVSLQALHGILTIVLLIIVGVTVKHWNAREEHVKGLEGQISQLREENASLVTKNQGTICVGRGLTLSTIRGIPMCMDPQTKALHKIEAED